jgi:hypothetical protein
MDRFAIQRSTISSILSDTKEIYMFALHSSV